MNKMADTRLKKDAADALKIIQDQAANALKVISDAAAEAMKVHTMANGIDHDLIIKLGEKVDNLILKVNEISGRDDNYALKEDFVFWRNILVTSSGAMFMTLVGIIVKLIIK